MNFEIPTIMVNKTARSGNWKNEKRQTSTRHNLFEGTPQ